MSDFLPRCTAVLLASALLLPGCTSRNWYASATEIAKADCNRMPPGAREDCLAKVNQMPYDRYEKERKKEDAP